MKIVEKMGWSKNPQDDKFKSFGIFFKNPIPFEKLFAWGPWLNRESKNSKINLKEFHFPIFELDDLKSKTIIQGLQTLSKYCQKKLLKMAEVKKEINRIVEIEKPDSKKTEVSILDTKEIIRQALMEWDNNENADATIKLFKLACEEGRDSDACLNLGGFIKDIQKDFPDSIQWFRKGCELGDEDCCIIADSFTKSLKDPKDSKKMIDIKNLGNQYRNTGNILEAERMFRIACDVGMNSDACWNLAELRRKWFKDIEGAKEWYIMACELGDKDACKEKNKDLEKEGIAKLEKEKNEDLEKERIAKLESEKNAALEKDRIAKLEREKNEVAEKERQKLEDEKKLWEKALKSFEKFYTTPDYSQVDFSVKSSDLVWAINSSNENGPIFAKAYVTKDHYLIGKDSNLKKMVCDQSDQCNPIRILIDFSKTCKADIIFQSWDAFSPNNKQQIWMKGTIDFSKDVREMKIVEKMGWSKNPKDDKFKSLGIFFKNPIPFENRFYKDGSNGEVIKSTINLTEFHFPIFDLDDLKSKTIIEGFKYVRNFCVYF
jgi:tetratricopeptide (TPR) repeat protein